MGITSYGSRRMTYLRLLLRQDLDSTSLLFWTDKRPRGIHEFDERGVPWVLGQVHPSIHWWYFNLLSDDGGAWKALVLGTTVFARAQIVWEVVQILFLLIEDSLLRACHLRQRYHCGSSQGWGYYGMSCTDECLESAQLHGFSRILSMVHRWIFEDSKSNREIVEEEK